MNIEIIKHEYMNMYDSLKKKIEDELKKFTDSTFFVDDISLNIVDNIIKTDVNSLLERTKIIYSSNIDEEEKNQFKEYDSRIKEMIARFKSLMINNYNARLAYVRQIKDEALNDVSKYDDLVKRIQDIGIPDDVVSDRINYRTNISKRIGTLVNIDLIQNDISDVINEYNERERILIEEAQREEERKENIRLKILNDVSTIEKEINDFERDINTVLLMKDVIDKYINLSVYNKAIRGELEKDKDRFNDTEYNSVYRKLIELDDKLFKVRQSVTPKMEDIHDEKIIEYNTLKNNIADLDKEITNYTDVVISMFDREEMDLDMFIDDYMDMGKRLNLLEFDVENKFRDKFNDMQLYNNLISYISRCRKHFDELGNKIKELDDKNIEEQVEQVEKKDNPKLDLSKIISALEDNINNLEILINNDFWDSWKRKRIDELFGFYEKKIQEVRGMINISDENKITGNVALLDRLDVLKAKLEELHNHKNILEYQENNVDNLKIPKKKDFSEYKVKAVKSAKSFYEKHKNKPLTLLGLVKLSFKHPTIIPALVHGMVIEKMPIRDKLIEMFPEKFTIRDDKVYMANGMEVDSKTAVCAMLKAIADSDVSNTKTVTGMIQGVKNVVSKAKNYAKNISNNVKTIFTSDEINDEYAEYIRKMGSQFLLSNLSFEEFCDNNNVSNEDKYNLGNFIDNKYNWDLASEYLSGNYDSYITFVNEKGLTPEESSELVKVIDQIYYNNLADEYNNSGMEFLEFCDNVKNEHFSREQFEKFISVRTRGAR